MDGENYVDLEVTLHLRPGEKSIWVKIEDNPRPINIPRSCLHAATDITLDDMPTGTKFMMRVKEWLANDRGMI